MSTGSVIELERRLDHPIERVWRAISEPGELAAWFVAPVDWIPAAGEAIEASGGRGTITVVDPPRTLEWTWDVQRFRFDLAPDGDGCRLRFTHVFDPAAGPAEQHAAGWRIYFGRLDAHLAGVPQSEAEAHTATLEDGPAVRLERRLAHSAERVWRALTEPEELGHWFPAGEPLDATESHPPTMFAGRWYGDSVRFDLRPDGDGCVLVLTHAFGDREVAARTAAGWDRCLARLRASLDGAPLGEAESLREWPEVHERLAARWGVDPEIGRQAFAAHASRPIADEAPAR